ncbi:MAG TPA: FHA domain-containing protein [Kofleriaceae bacterium]|jgi:hypothetical protein
MAGATLTVSFPSTGRVVSTLKSSAAERSDEAPDELVRLREWGTDNTFALPRDGGPFTAGASEQNALCIDDADHKISRRHLELWRDGATWFARDLGSSNGTLFDGVPRTRSALDDGMQIQLGGLTLVAESPRQRALRLLVARTLGYGPAMMVTVDRALHALRELRRCRTPLRLCGRGNIVWIARALTERCVPGAPFVVCDPRREEHGDESTRSAETVPTAAEALALAPNGTICAWADRLPRDWPALDAITPPIPRLVLCARSVSAFKPFTRSAIEFPPLQTRMDELPRLIAELADDAATTLAVSPDDLTPSDREWVVAHETADLATLDKAIRRLMVLHDAGSTSGAAARLGLTRSSLRDWLLTGGRNARKGGAIS